MNMKIDPTTISTLKQIYRKNEWARPFFEWAANRQKDANVTTIERLVTLTGIGYRELITLARMLEDVGIVRFIPGRKGFKSRIEWNFSVKNIGAASMGKADELVEVGSDVEDDSISENIRADTDTIQHTYSLRPDRTITITLPKDFTSKEAERFASFIQTLPFE